MQTPSFLSKVLPVPQRLPPPSPGLALSGAPSFLLSPEVLLVLTLGSVLDSPVVPGMPGKSTRAQRLMAVYAHTALASW